MISSSLLLHCLCILIATPTIVAEENSYLRDDPRLPSQGTKNWQFVESSSSKFTPRHGHATCTFHCPDNSGDLCIWLVGGYSDEHRNWRGELENANADVWFSKDGATWNQVTALFGDFLQGVGNGDAKQGGYVAPFYGRYGHSLEALDYDGDGIANVMVLAGGFNPVVSNDIWLTTDGITWYFDGYAPWSKRAYQGSTVFKNKLWILGGTPLSNDVWSGTLVKDTSRRAGYKLEWQQMLAPNEAPWMPRAGFCTVTQASPAQAMTNSTATEHMFIIGGLALSDNDPIESNGTRTRNDVWKTRDGIVWEKVFPPAGESMPWGARAFHSCVTWHDLEDKSHWIGSVDQSPRIFVTGGGYFGRNGNNEVRELESYTDTWYSQNASYWFKVNYEEGSIYRNNLYSTNEWTETSIDGRKVYRGKWGHTLEAFHVSKDSDEDEDSETSKKIPSLFVIGGKLEGEHLVNDVFVSKRGIHCEKSGITCSRNGFCGETGCECHSGDSHCSHAKMALLQT